MLTLNLLPDEFSICRLPPMTDVPIDIAATKSFISVTRTNEEVSVLCPTELAPRVCEKRSDGWRCLRIAGQLDLSLTGILSSLLSPLAASQISVFTISTFNTDYLLVPADKLERAIDVLQRAGNSSVVR